MYLRTSFAGLRKKLLPLLILLTFLGIATDAVSGKMLKSLYPNPDIPQGLTASQGDSLTSIHLHWSSSVGSNSYEIWRSTQSGGPFEFIGTMASLIDYDDTNLNCGSTFYYRIRGVGICGNSDFGDTVSGFTAVCPVGVDNCSQVTQFISDDFTEQNTTVGATNDYTTGAFSCTQDNAGTGVGPDKVYGIQVPEDCDLAVNVSGQIGYIIQGACDNSGTCVPTYSAFVGLARQLNFRALANVSYFLIVDSEDGVGAGYSMDVRKVGCSIPVPTCLSGSTLSQPPAPYGTADGTYVDAVQKEVADIFNVSSPTTHLRWWGVLNENFNQTCGSSITNFDIELYDPGFGAPSDLNTIYSVVATPVNTGHEVEGRYLYQYEADFSASPWPINIGFLRIKPKNVPVNCSWGWACSDVGNRLGTTKISPVAYSGYNQAFCLAPAIEHHTADQTGDGVISLAELLRVIQFYNSFGLYCQAGTEDSYSPGIGADKACPPHASDYNPQDWVITLAELLRAIQFYNSFAYHACPGEGTEDGFCPGL